MTTELQSRARLSDVAISITDGDHQAPPKAPQGVAFLTISAINDGTLNIDKATRHVPESYYSSLKSERKPEVGDILFSVTGSIAIPAIVDDPRPFTFQRHIAIIKPNAAIVDSRYLLHALRTNEIKEQALAVATGTAQLTIPLGGLRNFEIFLPPLQEQRRIVTKLDSLRARSSSADHELNHIPKLIERYKQAILAKAFSGDLTRDWREQHEAEDWQPILIENIAESIFDGPFGSHLKSDDYVNAGVRVIRLENIGHLTFKGDKETFISQEKYEQLRRHTLLPDDVIFSSFVDEEVRVCLFPGDLDTPSINKADCFCIRPIKQMCEPKWLAMRLASRSTYEILRDAVHGATRPRINLGTLKSFSFDLPSPQEQREMVKRIEHAFAWLDKITTEHARAEQLLPKLDQAILAKAFRGELVPQDPNDEPASMLLERIKAERDGGDQTKRRRARSA